MLFSFETGLPFEEPVFILAITMLVFLIFPIVMRSLRIPGIIGPILAGILIGPHGIGLLERDQTIELMGTVGLLCIIFIAGLEIDFDRFRASKYDSMLFGMLSFSIPMLIGTAIGLLLGFSLLAALLIGSILGSHTLLAYPIASRLGIHNNRAVTTTVGGTLLTDTFALVALAIIAGSVEGDLSVSFWLQKVFLFIGFVLLILYGLPIVTRWFFRYAGCHGIQAFTYVLTILFGAGVMAEIAGFHPIIGAFLAGISLNRFIAANGPMMNRIRFIANAIFIPFFLFSVGMLMNVGLLFYDAQSWIIMLGLVGGVISGKLIAAVIARWLFGFSTLERTVMFGLSVPQAAATLAATLVGYNIGLLNTATVNAVIIMIIVTCFIGPLLIEKYGQWLSFRQSNNNETIHHGPQRILVPVAGGQHIARLMEAAIMIRHRPHADHPLHILRVVPRDAHSGQTAVEQSENMLTHAKDFASAADVPVRLLTRLHYHIAGGIIQSLTEEQITTIVAAWNGVRSPSQRIFGSVLDQLLEQTHQAAWIVHCQDALIITTNIRLILPKGVRYKNGFQEGVDGVLAMAKMMQASITAVVIDDDADAYRSAIQSGAGRTRIEMHTVGSWQELYAQKWEQPGETELLVLMSARTGTVAWNTDVEKFPQNIGANATNFMIFYPRENMEVDIRGSRGTALPRFYSTSAY